MAHRKLFAFMFLALALLLGASRTATAAQSYDNCAGFITSLPAVISTQGTWCLKQVLATAITSGNTIAINTNNVTIDCNNFKLGGLAAGAGTAADGIVATDRANLSVRHCNIRGFEAGVLFQGSNSSGHVVEDNRFDSNTVWGVYVQGDNSVIRRNLIIDTGGSTLSSLFGKPYGIYAKGSMDILDNLIANVVATSGTDNDAFGIDSDSNVGGHVSGNRIRGVTKAGTHTAWGIFASSSDHLILRDNDVTGDGSSFSAGVLCSDANSSARDNTVDRFDTAVSTCSDDGGNVSHS